MRTIGLYLGRDVELVNDGDKLEIYVNGVKVLVVPLKYEKGDDYPYVIMIDDSIVKNFCKVFRDE